MRGVKVPTETEETLLASYMASVCGQLGGPVCAKRSDTQWKNTETCQNAGLTGCLLMTSYIRRRRSNAYVSITIFFVTVTVWVLPWKLIKNPIRQIWVAFILTQSQIPSTTTVWMTSPESTLSWRSSVEACESGQFFKFGVKIGLAEVVPHMNKSYNNKNAL